MNSLRFYPKNIRKAYEKNIKNAGIETTPERYNNLVFIFSIVVLVVFSVVFYFIHVNILYSFGIFIFTHIFFFFNVSLKAGTRIKKMEKVFPDVISLMASNLRAGITIDRSFLLSARPEFFPLDKEILKTGKEISTGQEITYAFKKMGERIDSEKIDKIILLIISGLKAGGNISDLLEQTSRNMKEKEIIEKKSASTILMYVVFIFFAVGIGAPVLFALSSVLVEIIINLSSQIPALGEASMDLPFTFNEVSLSVNFVIYFAIIFIIVTDFVSSLVIGYVNKGEGKPGLKLFIPLVILSLGLFFLIRTILSKVLMEAISVF